MGSCKLSENYPFYPKFSVPDLGKFTAERVGLWIQCKVSGFGVKSPKLSVKSVEQSVVLLNAGVRP